MVYLGIYHKITSWTLSALFLEREGRESYVLHPKPSRGEPTKQNKLQVCVEVQPAQLAAESMVSTVPGRPLCEGPTKFALPRDLLASHYGGGGVPQHTMSLTMSLTPPGTSDFKVIP